MTEQISPSMSVIIATPDRYAIIRKTIQHVSSQTIRHQLEIVIVASSRENLQLDNGELAPFLSHQVVEVGSIPSIGSANAEGVRRAKSPIVALAEDHCFPDPQWAERLLAAHRGPGPLLELGFEMQIRTQR